MYQCTASGCKNVAIFDMNICEDCFVSASQKSLDNMGTPEYFICGHCGERVNNDNDGAYMKHVSESCLPSKS